MGEGMNLRLPVELREKLEALAREGDRTLSQEMRRALWRHVEAAAIQRATYRMATASTKTDLRGVPIPNLTDIRPDAA